MMDVEFWILAVVSILAVVAFCDSVTRLSARLSSKLGLADALWAHVVILILLSVAFFVLLFNVFDASGAFGLKYYVRPQDYWITITFEPWLATLDIVLVPLSVVAALVLAIKQGRNVPLSVLAGMLGNIGTIVWMIRGKSVVRLRSRAM